MTLISTNLAHGHVSTELDPSTLGTRLSTLTPKPLTWLWPGFIPRGTLTLLDGDPGIGTSLLALTLAACLSCGTSLPDQTPLTQGTVLVLSPHADPASTIAPRLSAAGADLSQILLLTTLPLNPTPDLPSSTFTTRPFVLPRDLSVLTALIEHHRPALVLLDHLSALMPPAPLSRLARPMLSSTDPWAAAAPDLFTALAHLASATDCAILLVRHTSRGRPLSERQGTAPVHLLLLPDPRSPQQRLLCTLKNTLSAPAPNQTYHIIPTTLNVPRFHWLATNPAPTLALTQAAYSSLSPNRQAILRTLEQVPGPLGPRDIAALTGLSYDLARRLLSRMAEANEVARFAYGCYTSLGHPCLASRPSLPIDAFSPLVSPTDAPPTPSSPSTPSAAASIPASASPDISGASSISLLACVPLSSSHGEFTPPETSVPLDPPDSHPFNHIVPPTALASLNSATPVLDPPAPPVPLISPPPLPPSPPPHRASITTTSLSYTFGDLPHELHPPRSAGQ